MAYFAVIWFILRILPSLDNCSFEILVSCVIWVGSVRPSTSEDPFVVNCNVNIWVWVCNVSTVVFRLWNRLSVVFKDRLLSSSLFWEKMSSLFVLWDPSRYLKQIISSLRINFTLYFFPSSSFLSFFYSTIFGSFYLKRI